MMVLFVTALEKIRLELRDIRAALPKEEAEAKRDPAQTVPPGENF